MLVMATTSGLTVLGMTDEDFASLQNNNALRADTEEMLIVITYGKDKARVLEQLRRLGMPISDETADGYINGDLQSRLETYTAADLSTMPAGAPDE